MRRTAPAARRGLTLVEMVVATFVGAIVAGAATLVASGGFSLHRTATQVTSVAEVGHRALRRAADALRTARAGSLSAVPSSPTWSTSVAYDQLDSVDPATGAITWSPSILRVVLDPAETDDGTDEDGDGLIDERVLELVLNAGTSSEIVTILATGIPKLATGESANSTDDNGNGLEDEPGFCVTRDGRLLTLRLSLTRPDGYEDSFERTVRVRN